MRTLTQRIGFSKAMRRFCLERYADQTWYPPSFQYRGKTTNGEKFPRFDKRNESRAQADAGAGRFAGIGFDCAERHDRLRPTAAADREGRDCDCGPDGFARGAF